MSRRTGALSFVVPLRSLLCMTGSILCVTGSLLCVTGCSTVEAPPPPVGANVPASCPSPGTFAQWARNNPDGRLPERFGVERVIWCKGTFIGTGQPSVETREVRPLTKALEILSVRPEDPSRVTCPARADLPIVLLFVDDGDTAVVGRLPTDACGFCRRQATKRLDQVDWAPVG